MSPRTPEAAAIEAVATSLHVHETADALFGAYLDGDVAAAFIGSLAAQEPSVLVLTQNRLDDLLSEARQQGRDQADELREVARELLPLAYAWVDYRKGGDAADRFEARMLAALSEQGTR